MTIIYKTGNLFDSGAECLVCTTNVVGVMGKGIALQFKQRYPEYFQLYKKACAEGGMAVGLPIFTKNKATKDQLICSLPTKLHWQNPSQVEWIEKGLRHLANSSTAMKLKIVALTIPGTGNGGLQQSTVIPLMEKYLQPIACEFWVYGRVSPAV